MQKRKFIILSSLIVIISTVVVAICIHKANHVPPNIIFLLTDDQRWDAVGCAGNSIIKTPNMDYLAQHGTRFENAFVTTPICAASRASIFTGLYERKHGYTFGQPPLKKEYTDLGYPMVLKNSGYHTGFIGKFGVKVQESIKNEWFDVFVETKQPYFKEEKGKIKHLTDINFDHAISFLRNLDRNQPFSLSISTHAPHAHDSEKQQYFYPESCNDLYKDIKIPEPDLSDPAFFALLPGFVKNSLNRTRWYWRFDSKEKHQNMVKGYYRMISGVDMALGRLMKELKKSELDQNTIIVIMGDNGYFLGERGFAGKWTMHDTSIRVPFILYDPRNKKNAQVIDDFVLNIDLAPTLMDLAGIDIPLAYQGESLLPLIKNEDTKRRREVLTEHLWDRDDIPQTESVRTEEWKYIRYLKHPEYEELYDLINDPDEANNLASNETFKMQLDQLRGLCDKKVSEIKHGIIF